MIIDISKITEGKQYDLDSKINIDEQIAEDRGIKLLDGNFNGWYSVIDDIVAIKGKITFLLESVCDNCLEEVKLPFSTNFQATFTKGNEEEIYHYINNTVDATEAIKDAILLEIPYKLLCSKECKGLCQNCGGNLNKSQCKCSESELGNNNPFYILKSKVGGVKDGITKKKNF